MKCPFCTHAKTEIYNTRPTKKFNQTWRRRRCLKCLQEFTTTEIINAPSILKVVKAGQTKPASYSSVKLLVSLLRACDHRKDEEKTAGYLLETIEQKLWPIAARHNQKISTAQIIEVVSTTLKRFDKVAWIKYTSYHPQ